MPQVEHVSGRGPLGDWLSVRLRRVAVPSWLASGLFHICLASLLFSMSQWESCRGDLKGDGGDSFRAVGLRNRPAIQDSTLDTATPSETPDPAAQPFSNTAPQSSAAVPSVVAEQPPVPLQLPGSSLTASPLLGLGPPPVAAAGPVLENLIRPLNQAAVGATATGGGGGTVSGGTSFLGIKDVGQSFIYVIDRSASMEQYSALTAAKQELLSSVERLDESQEFLVIFYNNEPYVLRPRDQFFDMFRGTDIHRRQARQLIGQVAADGGTRHFLAIEKALQFNPDVIFLLTDGTAESALDTREMEELKRLNRDGTRIHCIEFGTSAHGMPVGNFLAKLASQHGGQYTYRNITQLNQPR